MYDYIIATIMSFIVNVVAFSSNIRSLSKKIVKLLNKPNDLVKFDYANDDHRK